MNNDDKKLLEEIYKNTQMNILGLNTIRKNILNENLRDKIDNQLIAYEDYKQKSQNMLREGGEKEESIGMLISLYSKININLGTSINPETENIISMLIKGTKTGVKNLAAGMNSYAFSSPEIMQMAADLINFEKNNISDYNDFI